MTIEDVTIEEAIKKKVEGLNPGLYEIESGQKAKLFRMYYPFDIDFKMDSSKFCLHCGQWIKINDFKILIHPNLMGKKEVYVVCPNAPECGGSAIDWMKMDHDGNTKPPIKKTKRRRTYREILSQCS